MQPTFSRFMHICTSEPFADVPEFTALIGGLIRWQHTVGLFKNYTEKKKKMKNVKKNNIRLSWNIDK